MSVKEGMDPKAVRSAGEAIESLGHRLSEVHDSGGAMLKVLEGVWEGADLGTFQTGWAAAGPQVTQAAEALRGAGGELRRQADDQEKASAGEGGGGWPDFNLPDFDFPDLNPFDDFDWELPDVEWPTMNIGAFFDGLWDGILDALEGIGDWWDDIPWWGQLIIGIVAAVVIVAVAVFFGAPVAAAIAVVAAVVGAVMTILDILDSVAEFLRNPGEFIDRLLDDPLAALGDLAWLLVGLIPYGIGKALQRFRKPLKELAERAGPWIKRKWDDLTGGGKKGDGKDGDGKDGDGKDGDKQPHQPPKDSPVENGREYTGTGSGRGKNAFPKTAEPNEVLYRTDGKGNVTYYQEYGPDGLPTKRVDINPNSAPHNGIPPPHVQEFERGRNPKTGKEYVQKGEVRAATPEEVRNL
ncbi:MAG: polymorphic toxin type 24 domain-containing protein [Janibacter sp.]